MLFLFLFVTFMFLPLFLIERYKNPNNHILIRCEQELITFQIVAKVVTLISPFATKINVRPFKVLWISTYIICFVVCLLISAL